MASISINQDEEKSSFPQKEECIDSSTSGTEPGESGGGETMNMDESGTGDSRADATPWYSDCKYQRYWRHDKQMRAWYAKHVAVTQSHDKRTKQHRAAQEWSSAYQAYYSYLHWMHRAMTYTKWWQGFHSRSPQFNAGHKGRGHGNHGYHSQRNPFSPVGMVHSQRSGMIPPAKGTTDSPVRKRNRKRSRSKSRKRSKGNKAEPREVYLIHESDLYDDHGNPEEEYEMEITEDMLDFFTQSAEHRKQRDQLKKDGKGPGGSDKYVNLGDGHVSQRMTTTEAPKERPGARRTAEMKYLYGKSAAMIHGMETAMQLTFDRNCDIKEAKLWPQIPLNIQFD